MLSTQTLIDLVGRKHDCLVELRQLGQRQYALIDAGDMTALLGVLAAKQRSLEKLQELERGLDPFRRDDPARRIWRGEAERLRCASLAERSARLLEEIFEAERRCEEQLRRKRDETALQLAAVNSADRARNAYAESAAVETSVLDLRTED